MLVYLIDILVITQSGVVVVSLIIDNQFGSSDSGTDLSSDLSSHLSGSSDSSSMTVVVE